jgi:hypothetical protein
MNPRHRPWTCSCYRVACRVSLLLSSKLVDDLAFCPGRGPADRGKTIASSICPRSARNSANILLISISADLFDAHLTGRLDVRYLSIAADTQTPCGVSPSICCDIENSGAVEIDQRALGGRYPSFERRLRRFAVYHREYYDSQNFSKATLNA